MEFSAEVAVEDGDVELSLGLSLGGHCKKGVVPFDAVFDRRSSGDGGDPDPGVPPDVSPAGEDGNEGGGTLDPARKRDKFGGREHNDRGRKMRRRPRPDDDDDKTRKMLGEAERTNSEIASSRPNHNPNPNPGQVPAFKANAANNARFPPSPPRSTAGSSDHGVPPYGSLPAVPMQYPYPPAQCLQFAFPYMVPWWSLPVSSGPSASAAQGTNVFQPVPSRSFIPFHASEKKDTNGAVNRLPSLTASQGSSFSAISDFHGASRQGGSSSSSDTRSNLNHTAEEKPQANTSPRQSEPQQHLLSKLSPDQMEAPDKSDAESTDNELNTNSTKSARGTTQVKEAAARDLKIMKHEGTGTVPPKSHVPPGDQANPTVPPLPEMPCVTTRGNGPNGKKITGFLYRYNENEISIVCVCHGSSFSPAEFIKHAGGTEVSHPLRHIIIVPSS